MSTLSEGRPRDVLIPSWSDGQCTCKSPRQPCQTLVQHELLYSVEDAITLARDIPLRDLQAKEAVQDMEYVDHEAAYEKVLRVIADAGGAA